MSSEILTMLSDQLLLIEGAALSVALGAMLWRRRYLLNRRCRKVDRGRDLGTRAASVVRMLSRPEPACYLRRVR